MPKTQKKLGLQGLANYKVYIEDTSLNSDYFNVSNIPSKFTGGRNSFLIDGSEYLQDESNILIEILDANGVPIVQSPVKDYVEGTSIMVSSEIYNTTAPGFCTVILVGKIDKTIDGTPIPTEFQNTYNVRWTRKVLVEPSLKNISPLVFIDTPSLTAIEKIFYNAGASTSSIVNLPFSASLESLLNSGPTRGYVLNATLPVTFSGDYYNPIVTGSIVINNVSGSVNLPLTKIKNKNTAFSEGYVIQLDNGAVIDKIYLQNGKYDTLVLGEQAKITSSISLQASKLVSKNTSIPISYAKVKIGNMNTVSGEVFKVKVYNKVTTNASDYRIVAEVPVITSELLTTSSIRGELPIGYFNSALIVSASASWYADSLVKTQNPIYPISRSLAYTNYKSPVTPFSLCSSDDVLLSSIYASVPVDIFTLQFQNNIPETGYFIGNKLGVEVLPTTEYTLQFDAYYSRTSGSITLVGGDTPTVDIYIVGVDGTEVNDVNPLGQKIGELTIASTNATQQWYESKQFNFIPNISNFNDTVRKIGIRLVIKNGFWNFSNISLKPAADNQFSPDEFQFLVPNLENRLEILQYKVDFYDINSNSTNVNVVSFPTYFTGSAMDFGVLQ